MTSAPLMTQLNFCWLNRRDGTKDDVVRQWKY